MENQISAWEKQMEDDQSVSYVGEIDKTNAELTKLKDAFAKDGKAYTKAEKVLKDLEAANEKRKKAEAAIRRQEELERQQAEAAK